MIRAALLLAFAACKGEGSKPSPSPQPQPVEAPKGATIEPAAAKLSGELWFVDETADRRVIKLVNGVAQQIGKGSDAVFGALYPTSQRLVDGRIIAIASHGDGRPDGEQLVLISQRGSITTFGPAAMQVRDPAASPDGAWVVAAIQTEGVTNLTLIAATGAATALTTNHEGNFAPIALSTDAIAFVSSRDGDSEIYRMNIDGSKVQRLTAFHREDYEPAIDVSGAQLAFTSDREQKVPRIFIENPDGTGLHRLTTRTDPKEEESALVWSPKTPAAYAYTLKRDGHALVVSVLGGIEKILTPPNTNDGEVAFSPDGKWLVLVREHDGTSASNASASASASNASASNASELVAYPLGSGEPFVVARGAIRTPRWF